MTMPLPRPHDGDDFRDTSASLSATLLGVASSLTGETVTLRDVVGALGEQGLLVLCAFLTLPFMFGVSIPGVSTVFGLVILLLGISIAFNRLPWLPDRLMRRPIQAAALVAVLERGAKFVGRFDRLAHPRLRRLTAAAALNRAHGLALVFSGVLLMFPLGLIPFSNTLPALAILFIALGLLQRDGVFIVAGYGMAALTVVYFAVLMVAVVLGGQGLASLLGS